VFQTGGLTFVLSGGSFALATIVYNNRVDWLLSITLKCFSLLSMLAWYWISVNVDIRLATDDMFASGLRAVLHWVWWPGRSAVVGIVTRRHNGVTNWPLPILFKTITSYKSSGFTLLKALYIATSYMLKIAFIKD
jgi:hypothetical protein